MRSVEAIIWDLDGTLVPSQRGNYLAYRQAFAEVGIRLSQREFCEHYVCGGSNTAALLRKRGVDVDPRALVARKHELHLPAIARGSRLAPGARRALAAFHHAGKAQALASANWRVVVEAHLERCRVRHYYRAVVCSEDVPRHKPHPDCFLHAAESLGVAPERCLVLEDSPVGVEAALAAGMAVIAVPNSFSRAADFSRATLVVPSLLSLATLDGLSPGRRG